MEFRTLCVYKPPHNQQFDYTQWTAVAGPQQLALNLFPQYSLVEEGVLLYWTVYIYSWSIKWTTLPYVRTWLVGFWVVYLTIKHVWLAHKLV